MNALLDGDSGPCELLLVSKNNLAQIVARIAPNMALVERAEIARAAEVVLKIVEKAAAGN